MKFVVQFVDLHLGPFQRFFASRCYRIDSPPATADILQLRAQETAALQPMKQWVESPRTDTIPVVFQLLHHRQAKDRLVNGVKQDVYTN